VDSFWFDNLSGAYEEMWLISLEEFYESCSQFTDQEYSAAPNDTGLPRSSVTPGYSLTQHLERPRMIFGKLV
jgi:hypothetical protein